MKQRDLLFAGLLLLGVSAFAQNKPTLNPATDPKRIFFQGFEQSWSDFTTTKIDEINQIQYYNNLGTEQGSKKIWEKPEEWQIYGTEGELT